MDGLFSFDPVASGTKGLVFVGENILVYRRDNKTKIYPLSLDLPGGGSEQNETPFETFRREVKEEFDLDINSTDITYVRKYPSALNPSKTAYFVVAKLPITSENKIKLGNEGLECFLLPLQEYLQKTDAWPILQEHAADYQRSLSQQ